MENKKQILNHKGPTFFDGAMGTELQSLGLKPGEHPERLNLTSPETILQIHKSYLEAGSNFITTNTFGANRLKLEETDLTVEQVLSSAIQIAKEAVANRTGKILLDIGPIGELLEPMGTRTFEEAYELFKEQVLLGVKYGVDAILIETMTDLYEAKAAVLAAKENSDLPVFCTLSFEADGRTFTGCVPQAMVAVLEGLGVDALGVNCSLGPKELLPIVDEILQYATVPVIVQANAGLPTLENGETKFSLSPEEFTFYGKAFLEKGVQILGGCCGTAPAHLRQLVTATKEFEPIKQQVKPQAFLCTPSKVVYTQQLQVVGERINPTGKKKFQEALRQGDMSYIQREALSQVEAGAQILDVNVGLPDLDEAKTMVSVVKEIQGIINVPLMLDSSDSRALEAGLRICNGKAIVNSVTGEEKVLHTLLPLVKKYGASIVGLTLDEQGIPESAEGRFEIAEKIVAACLKYGIPKENIFIDCLTLTVAAQPEAAMETIKAIQLVKKHLKVGTVLGVSNISFGLPNRTLLNSTFLSGAILAGLDLPIMNPMNKEMMDVIRSCKVLRNDDLSARNYVETYTTEGNGPTTSPGISTVPLKDAVIKGMKNQAQEATTELLHQVDPYEIITNELIPALDLVGERFEKGEIFLPQLIQSAETVKGAFEILKKHLESKGIENISKGKIILATVKGDIHDIGKNIVKVLLENYGYEVIDLGKDVSKERVIEAAKRHKVTLIGLSALMTTTVKNMEETIHAIHQEQLPCKIMVGGAVLTPEYAMEIGADFYAKDAKESVRIAQMIFR